MNDWLIRLIILLAFAVMFLYFYGLSKNTAKTEKHHDKDMTGKINPYTGNIMPDAIKEEEVEARKKASDDDSDASG